ncbi:MAG: hypothetical protein KatS3mg019_1398 [Fimbriimonadales bacterium]|nr:MAG: hypothetical protein KatS3mg019_1398 [Fimbriimonadales bacterium]
MRWILSSIGLCALLALSCAQPFTYQGFLRQSGNPANGNYSMTFRLYDAATGGALLGAVGPLTVAVNNGLFSVELNFPTSVWDGGARYLEIQVGATPLAPRVKINPTPYSFYAFRAPWSGLIGIPAGFADGIDNELTLPFAGSAAVGYDAVFRVTNTATSGVTSGVFGESASTSGRGVYGLVNATSGFTSGVYGESQSTSGTGVLGAATATSGFTYGVYGQSYSTDGRGVYGRAFATSGFTYGGWFENASTSGTGVLGAATATSGFAYGVYGQSYSTDGRGVYGRAFATSGFTYGGWFENASTSGTGVLGAATATSGFAYGVYGQSYSTDGRGVYGRAFATSGFTYGGRFENASTDGRGVYGLATATSGFTYGGRFESYSTSGTGVLGAATATSGFTYGVYGQSYSTDGRGVYGRAFATIGTTYGVFGQSDSSSGYGVYASGRFAATGTKSFQIDHPLMPETHYLNHFCAEAPEPMNFYSGNVVTDAQGYATVTLPDYFETINRDFRYQLTVVDDSDEFILAKVVRKIQNNRFVIRTSKPYVEVSWEVKAIRNDRWVQEYGFQTEQAKEDDIKGKYLHPELYGQPKERGIHYHPDPERPSEVEKP